DVHGRRGRESTLRRRAGGSFGARPSPPIAGKTLRVIYDGTGGSGAGRVSPTVAGSARVGTGWLRERIRNFDAYSGRASCAWLLPKNAKGKRLTVKIAVTGPSGTIARTFSAKVR